ncbi:hypothetical protein F5Y16DRAFT_400331 [Xylariaceae sp. FL0255]|nr:hypothetical protein F5Y16DRAFT_400331 [Xylariaceae sp. FL0255]
MAPPFNEAQLTLIEEVWDEWIRIGHTRPPKKASINTAVRCWRIGPQISSQDVGRQTPGQPRAQSKTPEQLQLLEEAFDDDPYPPVGVMIVLTYQTKLEPKQVKQWFDYKRAKLDKTGEVFFTRAPPAGLTPANLATCAARMWRAYKRDPEGYAKELYMRRVSHYTGESSQHQREPELEAEDEREWEQRWSSNAQEMESEVKSVFESEPEGEECAEKRDERLGEN